MTAAHPALAGLESIAWPALTHAYGPAEDTPGLLRLLTTASGEELADALDELWSSICHQGTVYPATVAAVPFLAGLAADGVHPAELLAMLGVIADSRDPWGLDDPDAARAAVAAYFDALVPLARHPEEAVRSEALTALCAAGPADRTLELLRERWQAESGATMRADVLWTAMETNTALAAEFADSAVPADPLLRGCAALALVRAGRPWNDRLLAAAAASADPDVAGSGWRHAHRLFGDTVAAVSEYCGSQASADVIIRALSEARNASEEALTTVIWAAQDLMLTSRSAVTPLAAALGPLVDATDPGLAALTALELGGARSAADSVHALAARRSLGADAGRSLGTDARGSLGDAADRALACLVAWDDPRAWPLVTADLADRPRALEAVLGLPLSQDSDHLPPFDAPLLDAIRHRLRAITTPGPGDASADPFSVVRDHNEPIYLARILQAWGPAAEPALPELIALLAHRPRPAARALEAIGHASPDCLRALRTVAGSGSMSDRLAVGHALAFLAGDSEPLLAAVLDGLGRTDYDLEQAADTAADLVGHSDVLAPGLAEAAAVARPDFRTLPHLRARVALARAMWRHMSDAEAVLPILREVFERDDDPFGLWPVAAAADVAAELGSEARTLIPALEDLVDDPSARPAAIHALLAIDPSASSERRASFAELLVDVLTQSPVALSMSRTLDVLGELGIPLPPVVVRRLQALLDQDERISAGTVQQEVAHEDERLRARIRVLLE
jgi:hypothetical protein